MRSSLQTILLALGILAPALAPMACKKEEAPAPTRPSYQFYSGSITSVGYPAAAASDGSIVTVTRANTGQVVVRRIDSRGNEIMTGATMVPSTLTQYSVTESNGYVYVFGTSSLNFGTSKYDLILVKFNNDGDTVSTKIISTPLSENAYLIKRLKDGGLVGISKVSPSGGSGAIDIGVTRFDKDGNVLWNKSHYTNTFGNPVDVCETENGDIFVVCSVNTNSAYFLRVNSKGDFVSQNQPIFSTNMVITSAVAMPNGHFMCSGNATGSNIFITEIGPNGSIVSEQTFGYGDHSEVGYKIVRLTDGSFAVSGGASGPKTSGQDILVLKLSSDLKPLWYRAFGGEQTDIAYTLIPDKDNNLFVYGFTNSFDPNFVSRTFSVLMDAEGNFK